MMITGKELDHAKTASGRDELVRTITFVTERNDIEFGDLIWMSHYRYVPSRLLAWCDFFVLFSN